jgi:solute carrier family 26 (sodium-independent chloride/iodide transporter), member 4
MILKNLIEIFKVISQTNWKTFCISVVAIILIYLIKVQINERFKHKLPVPIPVELLAVRKIK